MALSTQVAQEWEALRREPSPIEVAQTLQDRHPDIFSWAEYRMAKHKDSVYLNWKDHKGDSKAIAEVLWNGPLGVVFLSKKWIGILRVVTKEDGYSGILFRFESNPPGPNPKDLAWYDPMGSITHHFFKKTRRHKRCSRQRRATATYYCDEHLPRRTV